MLLLTYCGLIPWHGTTGPSLGSALGLALQGPSCQRQPFSDGRRLLLLRHRQGLIAPHQSELGVRIVR